MRRAVRAFSPRAWGWSGDMTYAAGSAGVFPTRVGMALVRSTCLVLSYPFSPRAWGWSGNSGTAGRYGGIAGVWFLSMRHNIGKAAERGLEVGPRQQEASGPEIARGGARRRERSRGLVEGKGDKPLCAL